MPETGMLFKPNSILAMEDEQGQGSFALALQEPIVTFVIMGKPVILLQDTRATHSVFEEPLEAQGEEGNRGCQGIQISLTKLLN